jgi:cyanate permease
MTRSLNHQKVFFGWWTVLVTGMISGLGIGFYFYGISALFKPIASDLGLSRAITSGAAGIGTMVGSLLAPVIGFIADKFGPKLAILAGLLMVVLGLMLMPIVSSVCGLYLVWGLLIGAGVNLGLTIAIDKALANWFVRKIGLAMGAKFALLGLSSAMALPCVSWLITEVGWRSTCLIWALVLLLGVPLMLVFVRNQRPEHYGILPDGDSLSSNFGLSSNTAIDLDVAEASSSEPSEFSLRRAMKTKSYWIMAASFSVQSLIMVGFNTHCIPFLTEMDFDAIAAGAMMGMMLVLTIPSRFVSGFLADRVPKNRLKLFLALPFFLQTVGIGAFLINQTPFMIYVFLILYGIAHGLPTPLLIVMISRYFGRKSFGSIFGTFFLLASPTSLFSPVLTGWLFDATGSYVIALILFASLSLFVTLLLSSLKAPTDDPSP